VRLLAFTVVAFFTWHPAWAGGLTHVQNQTAVGSGTSTLTATFPQAVGAGDLLVGVFAFHGNTPTFTVQDNINGAWTFANGVNAADVYYFENSQGAAAGTLTVTFTTGVVGWPRISMDEFAGVATSGSLDQSSTGTTTGTLWSAAATGPIPAGELVYAGVGSPDGGIAFTAGSTNGVNMTLGGQSAGAIGSIASEYVLSSAAGTQDSTLTASPFAFVNGAQATFKPNPDAGSPASGGPAWLFAGCSTADPHPAVCWVALCGALLCVRARASRGRALRAPAGKTESAG